MKDDKVSPIFTKELVQSIEKVVTSQALKEPKNKVCLLWLLGQTEPKAQMICFRKVLDQNKINYQMIVSRSSNDFEEIVQGNPTGWEVITPPAELERKLSPLLKTTIDLPKETSSEYLKRIYRPHTQFWKRYFNNFTNGKHLELMEKYKQSLFGGYPVEFMGKCVEKINTWYGKFLE